MGEKGIQVTILARHELTLYPKPGQPVRYIAVTYLAPGMPPRTIYIPKDEYSKEREKDLIRKDIEEYEKAKPETITV